MLNDWQKKLYYKKARRGSLDTKHRGVKYLKDVAKNSKIILDLGCGEGTRLNYIAGRNAGFGIDISRIAIKIAKKNYPKLNFTIGDIEKLPFSDNYFDLVYSAFVLEHLKSGEKIINEASRVLKTRGGLVFIAPNYGAPNRSSPNFTGSRSIKLIKGLFNDLKMLVITPDKLNWNKVSPKKGKYFQDSDTTLEPYLGTLLKFLTKSGFILENFSSCWEEELPDSKFHQKLFKLLSKLRIYPFIYWGPHLFVAAKKSKKAFMPELKG